MSCRARDGSSKRVQAFSPPPPWVHSVVAGPLQNRGWCLQERELSRRVIYYTPEQILWECRCFKATEFWPDHNTSTEIAGERPDYIRILDRIHEASLSEIYDLWHSIIRNYSIRALSKFDDTFPALAGLARIVSEFIKSEYVAGFWSGELLRSLAWRSRDRKDSQNTSNHLKPRHHPSGKSRYIAPSWSWASLCGAVYFDEIHGRRQDVPSEYSAEINTYEVELLTSDPFSQIKSAKLDLTARLLDCVVNHSEEHGAYGVRSPPYGETDRCGTVIFDVSGTKADVSSVRIVYLFEGREVRWSAYEKAQRTGLVIAVIRINHHENTYKRVGLVIEMPLHVVRDARNESITLV